MTSTIRAAAQAAVFVGLFVGESSVRGHGPEAVQTAVKEVIRNDALPTEVTHAQIYASPDGETHFRDVKVPLTSGVGAQAVEPFAQSELQAATTIRHVVFPAGWGVSDRDHSVFHNPTSARFVTVRRGVGWIRTSDGETRRFQAGDVIEVLDVAPSRGHILWVGEEPMVVLFSNHR